MRGNAFLILVLGLVAVVVGVLVTNDDGMVGSLREGQFAEGAYMAIWILVAGSALVFVFRGNWTGAVKSIAVYVLAFVVLIALYGYRAELEAIADRFMAELVPGRPIAVAGSGGRQFVVTRALGDHFRVAATVNGRSVDFLVDTGASVVALDRAAAEAIGIDTQALAYTSRVMTANGMARAAPVMLGSIRIGAIERENVEAAVMDREGDGLSLLGMSFLGTLSSFEFRGQRLMLTD